MSEKEISKKRAKEILMIEALKQFATAKSKSKKEIFDVIQEIRADNKKDKDDNQNTI